MSEEPSYSDPSPIFDSLDIDLVVKVLAHTAFSPFFTFFIPIFYLFLGAKVTDSVVVISGVYYVAISFFWFFKWYSRLYRNQGNLLFGPGRFDWGEQIVVITGGSSGIGELLANTLAVRNVNVVVLDVNPIQTENFEPTDVEIGQPTVLVNNAGVVQGKLILDLSPEDVKQTFNVNTLAHFWTLKAFLPGMIEAKSGHIFTMSSVMGLVGSAQMTDYCASKAALVLLNESLRYELDKRYKCPQIRTTLITPGHVLTPLFSTTRLPTWPLFKFLAPSLHPVTVVKSIIAAMDEQHSQTLMMPFYTQFAPFMPILPSFLRDLFQWMSGADYAMESFVKVSGRRPEEGPVDTQSSRESLAEKEF
ncbi:hypothetical protein CCMSSC00406_0001056 [Pleurotus cornucopiae]|uniref:Uncharacterized protein n=1 Tax=Pleurotus cornucopiae TaxID=5321 RepID=A0ACB7ILL8_PLECO|nr:hypothetical protein CCMSSC00406_0001056 [Pleurotus cornucopiae]